MKHDEKTFSRVFRDARVWSGKISQRPACFSAPTPSPSRRLRMANGRRVFYNNSTMTRRKQVARAPLVVDDARDEAAGEDDALHHGRDLVVDGRALLVDQVRPQNTISQNRDL
jgi:hypothetical protein